MSDVFQMIGTNFVLVMGMMIILWIIYMTQKNAGIVDIGWAFGFTICATVYFFFSPRVIGFGAGLFLSWF